MLDWLFRDVIATINKGFTKMSAQLDRLTAEVAEAKSVSESAVALLGGLAQQIRDMKEDPAALAALADELDASTNALGEAVAANTVAEGENQG